MLPRQIVSDFASCVRQQVIDGLGLWLGEFFLSTTSGFPWSSLLAVKTPSDAQIIASLNQFLLSVPGIATVKSSSVFNRGARSFQYSFWATLNNGQILTGGSAQPFVISGAP